MNITQRTYAIYGLPVLLLCLPLIAMQFTTEVNWTLSDFVIGAILLFGAAGVIDQILRRVTGTRGRFILCAVVLLVLFLVWAELAVGLFGTPFAGS